MERDPRKDPQPEDVVCLPWASPEKVIRRGRNYVISMDWRFTLRRTLKEWRAQMAGAEVVK